MRFYSKQENGLHGEHDSGLETVPAKRQAVAESKRNDDIAVSPNTTRSTSIRVRPIAEMLENSSGQKSVTASKANDTSSSISEKLQPNRQLKWVFYHRP